MKKQLLALALACMAGVAQAYGIKVAINPFKISSGPLNGQMLGLVSGYSESPAVMSGAKVYFFTIPYSTTSPSTTDAPSAMLNFLRQCDDIKGLDLTKFSDAQSEYALSLTTDASGTYTTAATIIPHVPESDATTYAGCYLVAFSDANREYVYISPVTTKAVSASNSKKADTSTTSISFQPSKTALTNYKEASFQGGGWYSTAASTGPVVPSGPTEPWIVGKENEKLFNQVGSFWNFTPETVYDTVEFDFPSSVTDHSRLRVFLKMGATTALKINKLKLNGATLNINSTDGGIDLLPYLTIPEADTDGFIDLTKVKLIEGYDWDESGHPAQRFVWIGDVGYMSLETAVAAATDSDVIKLTGDVAGSAVKIGKNLEIDLGGNVFDCNVAKQDFNLDGYAVGVAEGVTATIKNGTIKYTSSTVCSASVQTFGHLNVFGVTLAAADKDANPYSVKYAVLGEGEIWSNTDPLTETNCCTDASGKLVIVYPDEFYGYDVKRINQLPYTLTLSAERGTLKTTEVQVFVQHEGEEYTFAEDDNLSKVVIEGLKDTGYEHDGWAIDNGGGKTTKIVIGQTTITGDASLIAQYKPATYPITYYVGNGYKMTKEGVDFSYVYGRRDALYSGLTSPIAGTGIDDYFVFDGWYMDESFTNGPYDRVPAEQTGPLKLYAKWTESEAHNGWYYLTLAKAVEAANSNSTITVRRDIEGEALVVKRPMTFKGNTTDITLRRCTLTVKTDVTLTLNGVAFDDVTLDMTTEAASLEKGGRYELMKVAEGTAVPTLTLAGLPDTWNVRWKNGSLWLYETPGLAVIVK